MLIVFNGESIDDGDDDDPKWPW